MFCLLAEINILLLLIRISGHGSNVHQAGRPAGRVGSSQFFCKLRRLPVGSGEVEILKKNIFCARKYMRL